MLFELFQHLIPVAGYSKLLSFVEPYTWSILSFVPKPPQAHYPLFMVYLTTNFVQKEISQVENSWY
jgi:hypothetical protein